MAQSRESTLIKLFNYTGENVPSLSVDYSGTSLVQINLETSLLCRNHFKKTEGKYGEPCSQPGRDFPLATPHKCLNF